jgi:hypothetical protein
VKKNANSSIHSTDVIVLITNCIKSSKIKEICNFYPLMNVGLWSRGGTPQFPLQKVEAESVFCINFSRKNLKTFTVIVIICITILTFRVYFLKKENSCLL